MNRKERKALYARLLSLALAVAVAVTFTPLLGSSAFAEDGSGSASESVTEITDDTIVNENLSKEELQEIERQIEEGIEAENESLDAASDSLPATIPEFIGEYDESSDDSGVDQNTEESEPGKGAEADSDSENSSVCLSSSSSVRAMADLSASAVDYQINASPNYTSAQVNIAASVSSSYRIGNFYVFNTKPFSSASYKSIVYRTNSAGSVNINIPMRSHSTGYYYVGFELLNKDGSSTNMIVFYDNSIYFNYISAVPDTSGSYEVYHNYFTYMKLVDPNLITNRLYLEYSTNGTNWRAFGPMTYASSYSFGGLKPNKKYRIRFYYGRDTASGFLKGPYSAVKIIKTGKGKKPKIKSVTVKATKVKKHTVRRYGYYTGVYLGKYYYYSYNLKITVRLKKKPGTKGIYINGVKKKGNKKKYTMTIKNCSAYSRPRGKKFKVYVYSYQNASYGGYSPLYSKNKKVR